MTTCDVPNRDAEIPHWACPFCLPDAPLPDSPMKCEFWKRGIRCPFYNIMLKMRDYRRRQVLIRRMEKDWSKRFREFISHGGVIHDDYELFEAGRRKHEREQQGMK